MEKNNEVLDFGYCGEVCRSGFSPTCRAEARPTPDGLAVLRILRWMLALLLGMAFTQTALAAESAGKILSFTGDVQLLHGTEKRLPEKHGDLYSGDTIVTGAGRVQIRFADGTLLSLYNDTKFAVDDYHYGHGNGDRAHFSLLSGLMHTLTGMIDKHNYKLTTRMATLGVRGTEYSVQLDKTLHVSVDQGQVSLANAGGSVLVGAGQSLIISGPNVMPPPREGGKINLGGRGPGAGRGGPPGGSGAGRPGMGGSGAGAGGSPPPPPPGTAKL